MGISYGDAPTTPLGGPPSHGGWGGSNAVIDMGVRMYFLHKAFPEIVGKDYTLRAAIGLTIRS